MQQVLDFITLIPSQTVIALANLVVLYFILKKLLFKPINNMFAARKAEVDALYTEAEQAKAEAERVQSEYDGKIALAVQESNEILVDARSRAERLERELVSVAKEQASHILQRADSDARQLKKQAAQELQEELANIAIEIASRVTEKEIDESDHAALIDEFLVSMQGESHG